MANKTSGPESTSAPEAPVSQSASGPRIAVLLQQHQDLLVDQWIKLVLSDPEVPEAKIR